MNPAGKEIIEVDMNRYQIITFYEFREIQQNELTTLRCQLRTAMRENSIKGTIILAEEGFNSTVCGLPGDISKFISIVETILNTKLEPNASMHRSMPFRRVDVKIKPEIVTLKRKIDMNQGAKTHVLPAEWNEIIADPDTFILDTRNDYEYRTGTFKGAVNPGTSKFSELPEFVQNNLDPEKHKRVALFCTGGIRCEKFAPFMKQLGFDEVYQLKGGILGYLEKANTDESLWEGECFVFDDRVSIDEDLNKGLAADFSQKSS